MADRDFAADPSERILAAESRRRTRALIDRSSLGTPGAVALRKGAAGHELTAAEQADADAEIADVERELDLLDEHRAEEQPGESGDDYSAVVEQDSTPGSPFWHWRVHRDGRLLRDGWALTSEKARLRANQEITADMAVRGPDQARRLRAAPATDRPEGEQP